MRMRRNSKIGFPHRFGPRSAWFAAGSHLRRLGNWATLVPVRRHLGRAMPLIYLIAGEQSGDVLGARLMQTLRVRRPDATFAGVGGSAMAAEGLTSLFPIRLLALMGLLEVVPKI